MRDGAMMKARPSPGVSPLLRRNTLTRKEVLKEAIFPSSESESQSLKGVLKKILPELL